MSLRRLIQGALLLTLTAACGTDDDTTTPASGDPNALTAAEFNSMIDALVTANAFGFARTAIAGTDVYGPVLIAHELAAQATQDITIDQTQACPGGGSAHIDGTAQKNTSGVQVGTVTMYVRLTFTGCKALSSDGTAFTFDGNPTLNAAVNGTFGPGAYVLSAHETGDLRWAGAHGKTGTCPFSLGVTTTITGITTTGHATGEICGSTIDKTF